MVRPIFKSGDRNSVKNYRPISLLCVTSKVLERIVYNHIIDFVNISISPYQFGFLRHRSTLKQLLIFLNTIHISLYTNSQTDVAYLDFRKAFDSVAHKELLFNRLYAIDAFSRHERLLPLTAIDAFSRQKNGLRLDACN